MDFKEEARRLDHHDQLAHFREMFFHPSGKIYLEANSLGLLSRPAEDAVLRILEQWRTLGIEGWLSGAQPWFFLADRLSELIAPLVGAAPQEVGIGDCTTINLHKLLAMFYQPTATRTKILIDELAFPSDLYAVQSHLRLRGRDPRNDLVKVRSGNGYTLDEQEIVAAMTKDVQIAILPSVLYQSGQLLDISYLACESRARNVLLGIDCSHSVGVVPHRLSDWGVDFAVWCTYKYLNSGPGSVAAWYVNRQHFGLPSGVMGWFSSQKESQFDMGDECKPAPDARCLQVGTPNILSMAPLSGTLQIAAEAGIERVRRKSLQLTKFLTQLMQSELSRFGFTSVTPLEDDRRGGHVALAHPEALRICKNLRDKGVIVDYRPPHIIRLGPSPLATSFGECWEAMFRLQAIMVEGTYWQYSPERDLVS